MKSYKVVKSGEPLEEQQTDKANSDDMKNIIQAVDKMARVNG